MRAFDSTKLLIIIENMNGGQGKGYPNTDQTFQVKFNELLFISIALKLDQNFMDSLKYDPIARVKCHFTADQSSGKFMRDGLENSFGWG